MKKLLVFMVTLVLVLTAATGASAEQPKRVMFINGIRALEFFVNIEAAMLKEAEQYGWDVTCVDAQGVPANAADYISQAVAAQYDAVVVGSDETIIPAVEEAVDKGVVVINYDAWCGSEKVTARVSSDNVAMGRQVGDYAVELLKEKYDGEVKGNVIYMNFSISSMLDRCAGFVSAFEGYENVNLIEVIPKDQFIDESYITMENTLTAMPDGTVDVIFGSNSGVTLGALAAAETAGRKDMVIMGIDDEEGQLNALKDPNSVYVATLAQDPIAIGRICTETLAKIFAGEEVNQVVSVKANLVTKSNVEEYIANDTAAKAEIEAYK